LARVGVRFGWTHAQMLESHAYLLPKLCDELGRLYGGRAVKVLDLGCGNGYVANQLSKLGYDVVAVDQAEDGIEVARTAYPHVRFELVSLEEERLVDLIGEVDCVVSLEVLEHLFSPRRLFEQSAKLLRPGGHLILSTPYHGYLKNLAISLVGGWDRHFEVEREGGHIKFFSPATLRRMAEGCGFALARWCGAGRVPWLWKSLVVVCEKVSRGR